jgi:hypothetical protein
MVVYASILRVSGSQGGLSKSKEIFMRVLKGLVGTLSFALIFLTFNRDLLRGDIDFNSLRAGVGSLARISGGATSPTSSSNSSSASCSSPESLKQKLSGGEDVCGGSRCSSLSGCQYRDYLSVVKSESEKQGVDYRLAIVIMCKESSGKPTASNDNKDGTFDCGLMQVNQKGACTPDSFVVEKNIAEGIRLIKQKTGPSLAQRYPGTPELGNLFAAYNCCAQGAPPYAASNDCNPSRGWPSTLPQWACPVNPGVGNFNMCAVKNYVCDLDACYREVSSGGV